MLLIHLSLKQTFFTIFLLVSLLFFFLFVSFFLQVVSALRLVSMLVFFFRFSFSLLFYSCFFFPCFFLVFTSFFFFCFFVSYWFLFLLIFRIGNLLCLIFVFEKGNQWYKNMFSSSSSLKLIVRDVQYEKIYNWKEKKNTTRRGRQRKTFFLFHLQHVQLTLRFPPSPCS